MKVKCPQCGHIQKKKEFKKDNSFNARAMDFLFKQINATPVIVIDCEKCGTCFEQDKNLEVEDDKKE